jgi:HEAT repeat protein
VDPSALAAHTSALQEPLRHSDVNVRRNALTLLGAFPSDSIAEHTDALRTLLADSDPTVSKLAVELLAQLQFEGLADALSTLLELPEYAWHRLVLLPVLGTMSAAGSAAPAPAVLRLMHDPDPAVRASAIATLARLDLSALQENVGLLLTTLGDNNTKVRERAMQVLVHLPAAALAEHVPVVLHALKDTGRWVQEVALRVLGKVDQLALAAHSALLLRMAVENEVSCEYVWGAIELLPPAELIPHFACFFSLFGKGNFLVTYSIGMTLHKSSLPYRPRTSPRC